MNLSRLLAPVLAAAALLPTAASAETPLLGVPTDIRRGFYTDVNLGGFFTAGGTSAPGSKAISDAQAFISLGAGYDVYAQGDSIVSFGLAFSFGTAAGRCHGAAFTPGVVGGCLGAGADPADPTQPLTLSDNWTATQLELSGAYGHQIANRLFLTGKLIGGYAFIEPQAFEDYSGGVPVAGLGAGLEYATQFDHFSLGLDVAGRMYVGPNVMGVSVAPRVKYTF